MNDANEHRSGWEIRDRIEASRAAFEHEQLIAFKKLLYAIIDHFGPLRIPQSALDNVPEQATVLTHINVATGEHIISAVKR